MEPTWVDFGKVLAAKLEPSWDQMPPKPDPKTNQKKYDFLGAFWSDFWWILAPKSRFLILPEASFFGSWGHLGAKTAPRRPKKPQEAPKTASKTDFGAILVDFWLIFFGFFWWVWGFISALVDCCGVGLLPCWFDGLLVC